MKIWAKRKVLRLEQEAASAQSRIRELVVNGLVTINHVVQAWGPFLDQHSSNTHYGIYGTSAGLQILVSSGYRSNHDIIQNAGKELEKPFSDPQHRFCLDGDLCIVYKMCYLAEAVDPTTKEIREACIPMEHLITRVLPGGGWGEYYCSNSDRDPHPRFTATAAALLALSRYCKFWITAQCNDSIVWLTKSLKENTDLRASELALGVLALEKYKDIVSINKPIITEALEVGQRRLLKFALKRKINDFGSCEVYSFPMVREYHLENRYLFFLPHCLIALALMKVGCPRKSKRYILDVVEFFIHNILQKEGFRPVTTGRVSSVDHLWIYRLLEEFKTTSPVHLRLYPPLVVILGKVLVMFFLVLISLGGLFFAYPDNNDMITRITGGLAATVSGGLLVRFIWNFRKFPE